MSVAAAVLLGVVQGLTEFLPVSSSGHLSVIQNLFVTQASENGHLLFDVLLHLGTLVSICAVYRKDIAEMAAELAGFFKSGSADPRRREVNKPNFARRLLIMTAASVIPLFAVIPVMKFTDMLFRSTVFVGIALIINGFVLFTADKIVPGRKSEKNMTLKDALIVGLCQAVAVIPGISRSGATIAGGLSRGLNREFSIKFSFLASIPAVLGATLISIVNAFKGGAGLSDFMIYFFGAAVAAAVGFFAIKLLIRLALRGHFGKFAYYCWAVGFLTVIISLII